MSAPSGGPATHYSSDAAVLDRDVLDYMLRNYVASGLHRLESHGAVG
jgi:hypothetical protein